MSNGSGQSKAPYIIICSGRIDLLVAKNPEQIVKAASDAARNLVVFYGERVTGEDTQPISQLQHEMMDGVSKWSTTEARFAADAMFDLLDALEDKYES